MTGRPSEAQDSAPEFRPHLSRQYTAELLLKDANAKVAVQGDKDSSVAAKQGAAEFTSSLTAGVGGAIVYSLAMASTRGKAKALSVPLSMAFGSITKLGVKSGVEHALLDEKDRTAGATDLAWGAVDALAGIVGSAAEQRASKRYLAHIGKQALGTNISNETATAGARIIVKNSAFDAVKHNAVRGVTGGAAGTFTWSVPHRVSENWEAIKNDPFSGLSKTALETGQDTVLGSAFGGILSGGGTALVRARELTGQTAARLRGDATTLVTHHRFVGDFHSNLDQLPHMKTKLDMLDAESAAKGVVSSFDITGDALSGHVNFAFTRGGKVEYETLIDMGARKIIMGNHEHDMAGGLTDIPRWAKVMRPILQKNPQVSVLNANLDFSAYPDYHGLFKPYVIEEVAAPWGTAKVAKIGLTTADGALGEIRYADAEKVAIDTIRELNAKGVKHIILDTHLGIGEDIKLAEALIRNDLKVAGIMGGHTHTITPTPMWIGPKRSIMDRLTGRTQGGNFEVPIMHSGPSGRWLGDFRPAMRADGTVDRFLTTGRLHPITADIPADVNVAKALEAAAPERLKLINESYNATATRNYSNRNVRNRETALANLMSDAVRSGLKPMLGDDLVVMTHSGGIRDQIVSGRPLTRLDISNLVMNAGDPVGETRELINIQMPGRYLKEGIEYGIREVPVPPKPSWPRRIANLFQTEGEVFKPDESGNFVQVSGLKYTMDLTGESWAAGRRGGRVVDLKIQTPKGDFVDVLPDQTYNVVMRQHPLHKWWRAGMFGDRTFEKVRHDYAVKPVEVSQVDLIGKYIFGKQIDPSLVSPVEGRIVNKTATIRDLPLRPGRSLVAAPTVSALESR